MLTRLSVQNYAIIRQLSTDFTPNLNVITGETGAGKSIILGALGLILGERADSTAVGQQDGKCVVEGSFAVTAHKETIQEFFQQEELDYADEVILRREITPQGKSRAFINDTPVNLAQMARLSALLADLHQQFDTLELNKADFQMEVIDALAGNRQLLQQYREVFAELSDTNKRLADLEASKLAAEKELDYHQFQYNELEEAGFKENELEQLDEELKLLSNAEEITRTLGLASQVFTEGEHPVVASMKNIMNELQRFEKVHASLPPLVERLQSSYIEIQDIAAELENLSAKISTDEARLQWVNERMALGYRMLKKHGVSTTAELLEIKDELEKKLQSILNVDEEINSLKNRLAALEKEARAKASTLSQRRSQTIPPFEKQVNDMLHQVGMPAARLKVSLQPAPALHHSGSDQLEFLFNANMRSSAGAAGFSPVRKVASGGELSRLMLCIKSLVASSMDMPTLIFDEIDTGISGEAARQVGIILKQLATNRQIIAITHQPQLAGKADAHFFVYKQVEGDVINTGIRQLNDEERIVAIAKMLSGEKPTTAALENARELIMN